MNKNFHLRKPTLNGKHISNSESMHAKILSESN